MHQHCYSNSKSYRDGDVMDHLHVLFEHHKQRKALVALYALVRQVLHVFDPGVFTHGCGSVEAFPADIAGVRSLPSVSPHMFFQMTLQFVFITTNGADEWFLASVCSHVVNHETPGVCYSPTDVAGEQV